MKRDRIVVTGGSGFLGRRLVRQLVARGEHVAVALRDSSSCPAGVDAAVVWDLKAPTLPEALLAETRAVFHAAAFKPPSSDDPAFADECLRVNAVGSLHLLQQVVDADVPVAVSFGAGNAYRDWDKPASEDAALFPRRAPYYLGSKVMQEIFTEFIAQRKAGFRHVMLRPSSIYGPGMGQIGLIPTFASRLLASQRVVVKGGGRYSVDLVYVDDVAGAAIAAMEQEVGGAINVGSGHHATTREVANLLCEATDASEGLVAVEPSRSDDELGFPPLDITRACTELGFRPTPLGLGLREYVNWLRNEN